MVLYSLPKDLVLSLIDSLNFPKALVTLEQLSRPFPFEALAMWAATVHGLTASTMKTKARRAKLPLLLYSRVRVAQFGQMPPQRIFSDIGEFTLCSTAVTSSHAAIALVAFANALVSHRVAVPFIPVTARMRLLPCYQYCQWNI